MKIPFAKRQLFSWNSKMYSYFDFSIWNSKKITHPHNGDNECKICWNQQKCNSVFLLSQFYDISTIAIDFGGVLSNKKQTFYGLFNKIPINLFSFFENGEFLHRKRLNIFRYFIAILEKMAHVAFFAFGKSGWILLHAFFHYHKN